MASPSRRTSPRASSPLALPVLHLGSFSDLQLAGQFGIAAEDAKEQDDMNDPLPVHQRPFTPSTGSPPSASKLSPGIPFLRDSNINRRRTMIINDHPPVPLRQPAHIPPLDIPPPLPPKDQPLPSPITDHPDYADFAYRPRPVEGEVPRGNQVNKWTEDRSNGQSARVHGEHVRRPQVPRMPSAPLVTSYAPVSGPSEPTKRPHQQSRSMGAITLVDSYPPNDTESSSRPQTTYGTPRFSAYDAPAEVPTVPELLASVRGEGSGGGPYPSDARPKALDAWNPDMLRSTSRSLGDDERNPSNRPPEPFAKPTTDMVPVRVKIPPPQEEICVECLMRDRDLIHIDVTSPSVWSRASDADFTHMLVNERAFDRRWEAKRGFLAYEGPRQTRRQAHLADPEWDEESVERLQWIAEADEGLRAVVRWRGFSWEEDERKEDSGLPLAFRGRFEGGLYESSLRELARKNVSPSAHRFRTLQKYLRDQMLLIGIPPEEEPQLESNLWLRERERFEASYRPTNGSVPPNGRSFAYAPCGREQPGPMRPRAAPRDGYPSRATMFEASTAPQQAGYSMYDRQGYDYTEQLSDPRRSARVPALQLDVRKGRGISSPGLLELSSQPSSQRNRQSPTTSTFRQDQQYNFSNDDGPSVDWDPAGGRDSPLRPFSFAVWANKNGGASSVKSSPGPRAERDGRSVLGRWGGSVTSFFGGSQAGGSHWGDSHGGNSGSMMDMHLGLESDRRHAVQPNPRSVSMASPARPRFFSRASSSFTSHQERPGDALAATLTPVDTRTSGFARDTSPARGYADVSNVHPTDKKKKGFKGLLQKLKGRKKSEEPQPASRADTGPPSRDDDYPLAPPPPISFLVQRSDRAANHTRTSSSSSLSAFSGSSSPPMPTSVSSMMMRVSSDLPPTPRQKLSPRRSSGYSFGQTNEGWS